MEKVRVMHFMNQFFAGMGGEDRADVHVGFRQGSIGPGKRLQELLGNAVEIVTTVYCGDNYFGKSEGEALGEILKIAKDQGVKIVVAGPAFASGRYGFSCSEVCHFLSTSLGLNCITAMNIENPGLTGYKQYRDRRVFALPTAEGVSGMNDALSRMAQFILKLAGGMTIASASEEGYFPRGFREVEIVNENGAQRGIDMLLKKVSGLSFLTEIPIEIPEDIPVAAPITNFADACLALVTTSGLVPQGNPDGFKQYRNTKWKKYSIDGLNSMKEANWDVRHGGYDSTFMLEDPNCGIPLDVCRELESDGVVGKIYPYFYSASGIQGIIAVMKSLGREIALDMKAEGVNAVLLTSA